MRYLQAGGQRLVALEPDHDMLKNLVRQAGFECRIEEQDRQLVLELRPESGGDTLLLFDAANPANLGWFSRCQFYVNGLTGAVLQTPLTVANILQNGKPQRDRLKVSLTTELPAEFRLPGKQGLNEQVIYGLLYNLLTALKDNGVAICGVGSVQPLAETQRKRKPASKTPPKTDPPS